MKKTIYVINAKTEKTVNGNPRGLSRVHSESGTLLGVFTFSYEGYKNALKENGFTQEEYIIIPLASLTITPKEFKEQKEVRPERIFTRKLKK